MTRLQRVVRVEEELKPQVVVGGVELEEQLGVGERDGGGRVGGRVGIPCGGDIHLDVGRIALGIPIGPRGIGGLVTGWKEQEEQKRGQADRAGWRAAWVLPEGGDDILSVGARMPASM